MITLSLVLIILLGVVSAILSFIQLSLSSLIAKDLTIKLSKRVFDRLQRLPMGWHGGQKAGDLVQRITGDMAAPLAGVLRRYHRDLHQAAPETFADFLRRTLERCTFEVAEQRVTVHGGSRTAGYTPAQWAAIRDGLDKALGRLGRVEVVICPGQHAKAVAGGGS